jgi:non-heme chloroperoxidase
MKRHKNHPEGRAFASRRDVLIGGAAVVAAVATLRDTANAAQSQGDAVARTSGGSRRMDTITTKDGAEIYYKDWGAGRPVVFSHGWPLTADAWDEQMFVLSSRGFRCIAYDRRGHGRSTQSWGGNDYDTFADDLAALFETLDIRDAMLVGHSAGGGDVARYTGRNTGRISKAVLVSAIPPLMLKTPNNPGGVPVEVFDGIRAALLADRSQFYRELAAGPFYGANRPGSTVSQGVKDGLWMQCMQAGFKGAYDGVKAFSETDFTDDLKKMDVPTLIIHGEDDQNVPIANSALLSSKILKKATLKVYPRAPHGLPVTHRDQFNNDLLTFVSS